MRSRHLIASLTAGLLAAWPAGAGARSIGIFLDPDGAHCSGPVVPDPVATLYIIGNLGNTGAHGVQFRIDGAPPTWTPLNCFWQTAIPGAITSGHPIFPGTDSPGVTIGFGSCLRDGVPAGDVGPLLIGTLQLLLAPTPADVRLRVVARQLVPIDPPCPHFNECLYPHDPTCAAGGEAFLNNTGPDCNVAVQPATWSLVKSLFDGD